MPDKKLTDSEIVKALECCINWKREGDCAKCYLYQTEGLCLKVLRVASFDLINHLQAEKDTMQHYIDHLKAENERLKKSNEMFTDIDKMYSEIKAEAYKEFAERLKENITEKYNYFEEQKYPRARITDIDNLLKELVGE